LLAPGANEESGRLRSDKIELPGVSNDSIGWAPGTVGRLASGEADWMDRIFVGTVGRGEGAREEALRSPQNHERQ
jgi:hypothetical protein